MVAQKVAKLRPVKEVKAFNTDGWYNIITGLGTSKDKNTYSRIAWVQTTREEAEALYSADEMGNKVARIVPADGTREGVTWNMEKNADQEEVVKFIESEFTRLKIWPNIAWAWTQARVYGGAMLFLNVDDGRPLDTPLNIDRVRSLTSVYTMDRWDFFITSSDIISDLRNPAFGTPEFYTYNTSSGPTATAEFIRIHHTRLIRFDGMLLPMRLFKRNNYWHDSIYGSLSHAIRNYATTHDNIATIISDFNQPVYRIEGLSEAIAQDQEELVFQKLKIVDLMRSTTRAIVLDKEDEFQNVSTNVAGGRELIDLTVQRLVAGTDVPHTRLLGNSPSGLGATGEAELINYYDSVKSMQEATLREPLNLIVDLIFAQRDNNIVKPEDLTFEFNPLFQQDTETEQKSREKQALIDEKYITMGVYSAQEVADSRFGTGRYSYETVLDQSVVRVYDPSLSSNSENRGSDEPVNPANEQDLVNL